MIIEDYSPLHDYSLIIYISMGRRRRRRIGTYIQLPEGRASSLVFGVFMLLLLGLLEIIPVIIEH